MTRKKQRTAKAKTLRRIVKGVIYIVALLVAQVLAGTRTDIICPDTGPDSAVRDEKGMIAGVRRFMLP